jgi:hypothetical protein
MTSMKHIAYCVAKVTRKKKKINKYRYHDLQTLTGGLYIALLPIAESPS